MTDRDRMTGDQVAREPGLDDWRPVLGALRTRFATGDFMTGLALVTRVAEAAEAADHHPDLDLRHAHVDVTLSSHDVHATTQRDVRLARQISEIAADLGVPADPAAGVSLEIALDTWDADEVGPFWAAVLGGEYADGQVTDPAGRLPALWFQDTDRHGEQRQRFHHDVWIPVDLLRERTDAAVAAGGSLVSDSDSPSFVVLADAQGNRVCLCTSLGRGGG